MDIVEDRTPSPERNADDPMHTPDDVDMLRRVRDLLAEA